MTTYSPADTDGIVDFLHAVRARWVRGELDAPADRDGVLEFTHRADEMAALFETLDTDAATERATASATR